MATGLIHADAVTAFGAGVVAWAAVAKLSKAKKGKGDQRPA
jgi:hypothetical protein